MQLSKHYITPVYKLPSSKSNEEAEQDIEHFPPLRPSPRDHYLRKKCRQAKKAGARRARFALCGKTAVSSRTTAMDGSAPQLTSKKGSNLVPTSTPGNNNQDETNKQTKLGAHFGHLRQNRKDNL